MCASSSSSSTTTTCAAASSMGVREPLINFIRTQLGPMDLLGVMYPLTPVGDVRLTREPRVGHPAHREVRRAQVRLPAAQPVRGAVLDVSRSRWSSACATRCRSRRIEAIAVRLGGLREGRKSIILVSEGYFELRAAAVARSQRRDAGHAAIRTRRQPDGRREQHDRRPCAVLRRTSTCRTTCARSTTACNRANTAIYSLDPRGLAVFEFDIQQGVGMRQDSQSLSSTQDTLRTLAD